MAGIGAAIGEFTRGYATGLKLSSDLDDAQKRRDLYQSEIDTRNQALEKSKKIDAARERLAEATKGFFPMPDGTDPIAATVGIQDPVKMQRTAAEKTANYNNAMFDYLSIASPEKLDDFRRNTKSEAMQMAALDAARVTAGLMTQDPRALEEAARMNGMLKPGQTLDMKRSGYGKDKSVLFSVIDADGKRLPDQSMSREQIHFQGFRFLNDPGSMMQLATTYSHNLATEQQAQAVLAESARHHRVTEGISAASVRAAGAGVAESRAARLDAAKERAMQSHVTTIGNTYGNLETAILQSPEFFGDPKRQREALTEARRARGAAMDAIQLNMSMGRQINYAEVMDPGRMTEILSGRGVAPLTQKIKQKDGTVVDGDRIPGLGITPGGLIVRYQEKNQK